MICLLLQPGISYIFARLDTLTHTRNFYNSIGDAAAVSGDGTETLKIAINKGFVRYFIESGTDRTLVFYGDYTLHSVSGMEELADQLSNILSKDTFLSKAFKQVKVCWFTDFEIVPTAFFDTSELAPDTAYNSITDGEANFIFDMPKVVSDVLGQKYPSAEHHHSGAAMIERLRTEGMAGPDKLFVNIHADNIEIVCFDANAALRLYNRYEYKAYQDYIYFVLLVADEIKMDREEGKAVLMGEVSSDSKLYEMTNRYFRHTAFIHQPGDIQFSRAFDEYPKHFNYPLYNL